MSFLCVIRYTQDNPTMSEITLTGWLTQDYPTMSEITLTGWLTQGLAHPGLPYRERDYFNRLTLHFC